MKPLNTFIELSHFVKIDSIWYPVRNPSEMNSRKKEMQSFWWWHLLLMKYDCKCEIDEWSVHRTLNCYYHNNFVLVVCVCVCIRDSVKVSQQNNILSKQCHNKSDIFYLCIWYIVYLSGISINMLNTGPLFHFIQVLWAIWNPENSIMWIRFN